MNAQLSAAWNTAEQSRWEGLDVQEQAVEELLQAIKLTKRDLSCDESGTAWPHIEPLQLLSEAGYRLGHEN